MSVIFLVLPIALVVVLVAVAAFVWGARRGQFDDLETPALRMLHDDPPATRLPEDPRRPTAARRSDPPAT